MNTNKFKELTNEWFNKTNIKYNFIITKSCGYEFIVPVYKKQTLRELYYTLALVTDSFSIYNKLYISKQDMDNENNTIQPDNTLLYVWVNNNRNNLECLTNVPDPIAYRLWFNDKK
jgi:hypothetical protein|tara:strand:+ start:13 stop:360 length:348 start_codon:yes stop_codon:yes gene_type:complete